MQLAYIHDDSMAKDRDKKREPTVAIREDIHKMIKQKAEARGIPIVDYVNDVILSFIEKEDFVRNYNEYQYLSMAGYHQNSVFVKDNKVGRTAEIFLKENKLYCTLEDTDNCIHIHFALAQPEVAKLNIRKPRR